MIHPTTTGLVEEGPLVSNMSSLEVAEVPHLIQAIQENQLVFDRVIASTHPMAKRILQPILQQSGYSIDNVWFDVELQYASLAHLISIITLQKENVRHLLFVGNESSLHFLGEYLTGNPVPQQLGPCSMITYSMETDDPWSEIQDSFASQTFIFEGDSA